ncbi:hypothetical protein GCM10020331_101830 [Ectobacillus funiculus]
MKGVKMLKKIWTRVGLLSLSLVSLSFFGDGSKQTEAKEKKVEQTKKVQVMRLVESSYNLRKKV